MKGFSLTMVALSVLCFLICLGAVIVNHISFDRNCGGYLKRAADANTIELAEKNLNVAVEYLERNEMTSGYTSVVYRTPDEDVGFWYQNLKASLKELREVKPDATQLEKSNILMKLRETLLDSGEKGVHITAPDGISRFPNNTAYTVWVLLSLILAAIFSIMAWANWNS